jgi:cytochrome c biogenesis protein CcdA
MRLFDFLFGGKGLVLALLSLLCTIPYLPAVFVVKSQKKVVQGTNLLFVATQS